MIRTYLLLFAVLLLAACANLHISQAINSYNEVADQIQLGDSKENVLAILLPTQQAVAASDRKKPEQYRKDGVLTEIYYMRIANYMDGLVTDDEFMPYIFNDGVLVGIGWQMLGGPKTQGQVSPPPVSIHGGATFVY